MQIDVIIISHNQRWCPNKMNAIRRFGSAMIVPVLLFPFFGIIVGLATLFKNEQIMGGLADPDGLWYQIWT